jgi:G3E family GTPase
MKKIDLITGFLGAGKTSFIRKYAEYLISQGQKICILENDFGAINIDRVLLKELEEKGGELSKISASELYPY